MRERLRSRRTAPYEAPSLVRVALETRDPPPPGIERPPFRWPDVLESAPPRAASARRYCVLQGELLAGTERVEQAILIAVHEGGVLDVEDLLCVTPRALAGAIQTERALIGATLEAVQKRGDETARRAKRAARRIERRNKPLGKVARTAVAGLHKLERGFLSGLRGATRGLATLPDRIGASARRSRALLATREGRKRVLAGLREPGTLDRHEKAVTLFVGTSAILLALLVAHLAVTLVVPAHAVAWRAEVLLFLYGYVSSVGIPFPWEPALLAGASALGPWRAIAIAVAAKLVAGYMVFFVGDEVNEKLEAKAARSPRFAKLVSWSERFARRFGVLAMAVFIATPGLPDAIALYVFGSLGMPMRKYLLGILLGAFILDVAVIFGLRHLLGF